MKSILWRVAAGDEDKDLVPLMIRDQIMLIGPGSIGNIADMRDEDVLKLPNARRRDLQYLTKFRTAARKGHLVALRLGSVCFSVGVIESDYFFENKHAKVFSYWNSNRQFYANEVPWDLQHARRVKWFGLTDMEALCHFRKGIYGGPQRFCRVGDGGKAISATAKQCLDQYLSTRLKYNNENGDVILNLIGKPCTTINEFGFPAP